MKTVYWAANFKSPINSQFITPKINQCLFDYIKKNKKILSDKNSFMYLACPAATPSLKNIFRVQNEIKLDIQYGEDNTVSVIVNENKIEGPLKQGFIKSLIHNRSIKDRNMTLQYDIILFCEESLEVEQIQPWWDNTDFSRNTASVFGKFDISKWVRPIQPTFVCLKNEITIEEGDALYYLKFNTEEKINLVEFEMTPEIDRVIENQTAFKFLKPFEKMSSIYDIFIKNKINKKIFKLIKKNII